MKTLNLKPLEKLGAPAPLGSCPVGEDNYPCNPACLDAPQNLLDCLKP